MTKPSSTMRVGWWRLLLAALAAAVTVLLGAGTASAATVPVLETRVGASGSADQVAVGIHACITAGQRWGNAPPAAVSVVATGVAAVTGPRFFRGARGTDAPSFTPRPNEFKVDPETGLVRDTHGVSVFDNAGSVSSKGFTPHEINQSTIPVELRIIQRGQDPHHYEIVPQPGANLTPEQFGACLSRIECY
jgi:hypothetical protein